MPELPEVETTCRGIDPHITGKTISKVTIRNASLRWPVPTTLSKHIKGNTIHRVYRRAKYIIIDMNNGQLIIHLGMSGSLRISKPSTPLKKHDHVIFAIAGQELRYHDPRRFGCVLWHDQNIETHPLIEKLGPEPLSDDFDVDYLFTQSRKRKTNIKMFIMNAHIVVGVGNIYACEALFMSGIHPTKAAGSISKKRMSTLVDSIKLVLSNAITSGGTTLRDFVNSDGQPGYFQQQLHVYGQTNNPCVTCGRPIKVITLGQRSTFFCNHCQT